jgi:hypothetical protein
MAGSRVGFVAMGCPIRNERERQAVSKSSENNKNDCPSGKVRYKDKMGAKMALATVRRRKTRHNAKKEERTYYRCMTCQGFHLTSQR